MGDEEVEEDVVAVVGGVHTLSQQGAGEVGVHVVVVPANTYSLGLSTGQVGVHVL